MKVFFTVILYVLQFQGTQQVTNVLDTGSGLSNNIVHSTYQDSDGFIWVATESGLNRFDGYEIVSYFNKPNDSTSLSSNTIRSIVEDSTGIMWVGSYNGLNQYQPSNNSFYRFIELPEIPTSRLDLQELIYDEVGHRIWFNTLQTTGWFDINTKEFHFLPKEIETFSITSFEQGILVYTKNYELFLIDRHTLELIKIGGALAGKLSPIHVGEFTKKLWITDSFKELDTERIDWNVLPPQLNTKQISSLKEVSTTKLWIGTDEGLFEFDHTRNSIREVTLTDSPSFLTNSIQSIFTDIDGGIWVGTLGGLFYFNSAETQFRHMNFTSNSVDVIMAIAQDDRSALINMFNRELLTLDLDNFNYGKLEISDQLSGDELQIWDIEVVQNSLYPYWIATNNGLVLYNPETNIIERKYFDQRYSQAHFAIEPSRNGSIFISTLSNIYELDRANGTVIRSIETVDFVKQSIIQDLLLINEWMFIATEGEGLAKVHIHTDELIEISDVSNGSSNPLTNNAIWDIYLGENNILWIGTSRGLFYYQLDTGLLKQIAYDAFISNRIVYSILEYEANIWIGTEQGLIQVSKNDQSYKVFGSNEGVLNFEFNRRSALDLKDGMFLFGGVDGLTLFDPSEISNSNIQPPLHIIDMKVYERDSSFTPLQFSSEKPELAWNQNTVEFSFAALNYSNPQGMHYRYQLIGLEENWVFNRTDRNPRYAQLPPGDYEFVVQSSLDRAFKNVQSENVIFRIRPPFWQTLVFRLVIISLFIMVIWVIYRYRVESLLEVERVRLRIARDLHDEVGSGLSGIALAGDVLAHKMQQKSNGEVDAIKKMTSNARSLASSLDAIVWLIDSNKETLGDLVSKCRSISNELLVNHQVNFIAEVSRDQSEIILSSNTKRHLFLFIKEAINNLLKHASADSASISLRFIGSTFEIKIVDDGSGFNPESTLRGNGLESMNYRANQLGAEFEILSEVCVGTTIKLLVKLPESRYS